MSNQRKMIEHEEIEWSQCSTTEPFGKSNPKEFKKVDTKGNVTNPLISPEHNAEPISKLECGQGFHFPPAS